MTCPVESCEMPIASITMLEQKMSNVDFTAFILQAMIMTILGRAA